MQSLGGILGWEQYEGINVMLIYVLWYYCYARSCICNSFSNNLSYKQIINAI